MKKIYNFLPMIGMLPLLACYEYIDGVFANAKY